jgi:hypothetical protein
MIKPPPPKPRGVAGFLLPFFLAAGGLGLGLDLMLEPIGGFSIAAQPGGRAVLGVLAASGLVLVAHALRWALGRTSDHAEGGARARDRA